VDPDPRGSKTCGSGGSGTLIGRFYYFSTILLENDIIILNNPHKVVEVVLQRTGAPFEVMAELWDFFRRPDRLNASFKARSATLGTVP
jgi:hypothetical protein